MMTQRTDSRPARLFQSTIHTPLGAMIAVASDTGLCGLEFVSREPDAAGDDRRRLAARLARWFPAHTIGEAPHPTLARTRRWLTRYFEGIAASPDDVPLDLRGTPFERRVWAALLEIPAGATSSYGAIARKLDAPGASRAVGLANGANPVSIIVPCHRVIGSSGNLTGYGGGLDRKARLLKHEARWSAAPALF